MRELVFRQRTESVALRQVLAPSWAAHHWYTEQLDLSDFGLVSSVVFIWRLFVSVSPSVLFRQSHTSSSLPNPHLIFIPWIYFHSKGASTSPQWSGKFFPLVSLDWFFAQALSDTSLGFVWAVTHVLFVDDESRGDSICQFACFFFQVISCFRPIFVFLARSSFGLRHRPFNPPGSASPPQVAKSFQ